MSRTVLFLAFLLTLPACGEAQPSKDHSPGPEPAEWVRPFAGFLPDDAPEGVAVFHIVDARTGEPIEGAVVRQHPEIEAGPEGWAPAVREATSDVYGIAWFESEIGQGNGQDGHWAIHAEGYASVQEYGFAPQTTIELVPPRTRHGRLVDGLGRPLVGMHVGYKEGCGHSPFLATAVTDEDGRFVISGVDGTGDVYYAARGVLGNYFRGELRPLEETPHTDIAKPAIRVHGRISGADIATLAPRMVHALAEQRGPFGRIEDDGSFVIDGAEADGLLTLWLDSDGSTRELSLGYVVRPRGPFVWDLRLEGRDPTKSATVAERTLRVTVTSPTGKAADWVTIAAYRAVDGRRQDSDTDNLQEDDPIGPGIVELKLLPGLYDLVVGTDDDEWHAAPVRVEIGKAEPEPLVIKAEAWPRLELVWPKGEAGDSVWTLAYAGPDGFIDHEELHNDHPHVPPEARARVFAASEYGVCWADLEPPVDGVRRAVIRWPSLRRIRFQSDQEPDSITIGNDAHEAIKTDTGYEIETALVGRFEFVASQESGRRYEPMPSVRRMIDLMGPAMIDLGALEWPALTRGTLTVLDGAGEPLVDEEVTIHWIDERGTYNPIDDHRLSTDEEGQLKSTLLRPGAWITLKTEDQDVHQVLEGPGPWTVRLGAATIEVEVHGRYGILTGAALTLDGEAHSRSDKDGDGDDHRPARFTLKALKAGPHVLLVTAPGHRGEARRIVLEHGETRRVRIDLPERD